MCEWFCRKCKRVETIDESINGNRLVCTCGYWMEWTIIPTNVFLKAVEDAKKRPPIVLRNDDNDSSN